MENKRKNLKKNQIVAFLVTIAIVVLLNVIGSYVFTRFDLTSEKRYTLSPTTKEILKNLNDYVYFRVYLEGDDLPAEYKKMRRETKEMLDEFRAYSKFIDYEFINPSEGDNDAEIRDKYTQLYQSGLDFTRWQDQGNIGSSRQLIIWPGALVSYRNNTEIAVNLLHEKQNGQPDEYAVNSSIENLEFYLIDAVKKVTRLERPKIAFTEGHGELSNEELGSIAQTLSRNYDIKRLAIDGRIDALLHRTQDTTRDVKVFPSYDAVVVAKPTEPFDEKDKFLIDQYIMHGGKVLWLVEPVYATMDSLQDKESTVGMEQDLNLDDMLFKYGVRLNRDLLLDMTCATVPIIEAGERTFYPWYYFPLLKAASDHPIVRNMNGIRADFVSSMDATTSANGVEQIPLLKTSSYTKVSGTPVFISLAMLRQKPNQRMFNVKDGKIVAYLLKGNFTSLYANRIPQEIVDDQATDFMEESVETAMIVVADGDIIRNQFDIKTGAPLPLGQDRFSKYTYNNQNFIENAISYLVDGEDMIDIRSRTLTIRLLDTKKVNSERLKWQVINTVVPIAIIIVFGFVLALVRKRKYSKTERHEEK
ncbi:MAG: gliding motility-associated ABC transporter substrate-binding protein GldG [Bacteroidales bacterium]|nr:gliding motility-associated ABC transporter substrate-binding protein GldG [Bacteroidales bacterium]